MVSSTPMTPTDRVHQRGGGETSEPDGGGDRHLFYDVPHLDQHLCPRRRSSARRVSPEARSRTSGCSTLDRKLRSLSGSSGVMRRGPAAL